jgi:hypothetical protein
MLDRSETFLDQVLQNQVNRTLLDRLPVFGLDDMWLVAGCLFQTVWNLNAGRPPEEGIRDYDMFYFNGDDLSWNAEDAAVQRVAECTRDLAARIELRNQARVHLWYGERFGPGYPQLQSSRDGIDRFLIAGTCVGVRLDAKGDVELYAPNGLDDIYDGVLRMNAANPRPDLFIAKAETYRKRWPWLRIQAA